MKERKMALLDLGELFGGVIPSLTISVRRPIPLEANWSSRARELGQAGESSALGSREGRLHESGEPTDSSSMDTAGGGFVCRCVQDASKTVTGEPLKSRMSNPRTSG